MCPRALRLRQAVWVATPPRDKLGIVQCLGERALFPVQCEAEVVPSRDQVVAATDVAWIEVFLQFPLRNTAKGADFTRPPPNETTYLF